MFGQALARAKASLSKVVKNPDDLQALLCAGILVGAADGKLDDAEFAATVKTTKESEIVKTIGFTDREIDVEAAKFEDMVPADGKLSRSAKARLFNEIQQVADKSDNDPIREAIVYLALDVADAGDDNNIGEDEKAVIRRIGEIVGKKALVEEELKHA